MILTLDEEANLPGCLDSCAWCDDVHVLDSGSRDRTAAIARERGVGLHVHPFESFGSQRNWAIDHVPTRHGWVFHLDADERFTPGLVEEMGRVVSSGPAEAGFYVANQMVFMGRWIKRAAGYPAYQMRLFHTGRMRFIDHGHGQRESPGTVIGRLKNPYVHLNFSKGLEDWIARHNRYSTAEAAQIVRDGGVGGVGLGGLFSGDSTVRRRALKGFAAGLPMRPQLRWLYTVVAQGAFLDGRAGLTYAGLVSMYERMIQLKVRAMRAERSG
ncbi:MAG: glycosyltransferase family 2 protein [Phycisphaeraceae bacterium]|nr:MAG: glycosyltransferase family 2 protein [Phycisphaeraceae bacterium]